MSAGYDPVDIQAYIRSFFQELAGVVIAVT